MKVLLLFSILFCAIVGPLHADTSKTAIETDIAVIKEQIQSLNSKIDHKFESVDDRFEHLEKRFDSMEKNFDRQNALIIACIAVPMALIAIMITWRSVKDNSLQRQIDALSAAIESQQQQLTEKVES